ncbi:DUF4145 domain-containing protein [Nocardioides marmoribigeumensis]|uniref:DUF4145 domain-containing protein n=1 Tax=Nocardioides marmoribigeumensis TaxID=433649 RepID=A0ABU2C0B7_9ACTN|nr:DUF4145 domain-containing protein [Nocardioides marmoribigeumensis]MDR7364070.1 hypothetical protein [Nocardioides marmoribigeumensis]
MASTNCGHCGRLAYMEPVSHLHASPAIGGGVFADAVYKCPNCKRLNMATERTTFYSAGMYPSDTADNHQWSSPRWFPRHLEVIEFEDVPTHIGEAASEATLCLAVGAYRAAGALARAVIEATAKDKKAEGRNLEKRIDALRDGDHIRKHTQEQAHEIRHFGNDMAHGDFVEPVTKEEAEEVVELMAEVLDEVYQSPARLEKRKAARVAKKAKPPAP